LLIFIYRFSFRYRCAL